MGGKMKDILRNASQDFRLFWVQLRKNINNEMALRSSFLIQMVGMAISNASFFIIWIFFSQAIGTVNGWGPLETFGMLCISILNFGVSSTLFGGLLHWYNLVPTGAFDTFLTKPKSVYVRIMNFRCNVGAIGDLFQGAIGLCIFIYLSDASWESVLHLTALLIPSFIINVALLMMASCVIFWIPQAPSLCQALFNIALLPTTQPISLLDGAMRFIYLFIIPVLFVAGIPIESFIDPNGKMLAIAYGTAFVWLFLSHALLSVSIKRYESGNSIG